MPTGYTSRIKEGYTFREFAMDCARAFGACVTMRDDPGGGEKIPERFDPSDYHLKKIAEAEAEIDEIEAMSPMEAAILAQNEWANEEAYRLKRLAEMRAQRELYEAMADQAERWNPPTADHQGLRRFMLDQIRKSIDFDCGEDYCDQTPKISGTQWRANRLAKLRKDLSYHADRHREEVERAAERTAWIMNLCDSLPLPTPPAEEK